MHTIMYIHHITYQIYRSVPGKRPLPGKRPCAEFQGVTFAASIQTYGIYIPGKHPCRSKSRGMFKHPWALTRDTTVYTLVRRFPCDLKDQRALSRRISSKVKVLRCLYTLNSCRNNKTVSKYWLMLLVTCLHAAKEPTCFGTAHAQFNYQDNDNIPSFDHSGNIQVV